MNRLTKIPAAFKPRFEQSEADGLAKRNKGDDAPPFEVGAAVLNGDYSRQRLEALFTWKTKGRGRSRLAANSDADIEDALRMAVTAVTPGAAIAVLTGLSGVAVPVASAIMTCVRPDNYTIIDYRALHSLSALTSNRNVPFYLKYMEFCVRIANEWRLPLRAFDRALWQWSKENNHELLGVIPGDKLDD